MSLLGSFQLICGTLLAGSLEYYVLLVKLQISWKRLQLPSLVSPGVEETCKVLLSTVRILEDYHFPD